MHRDLSALAAEQVVFLDQTMECQGRGDKRKGDGRHCTTNRTLSSKTI